MNPYLLDRAEAGQLAELEVEVHYDTEWDEFWSFVGSKACQRWTWYLIERQTGLVLAFHHGRRTDQSLRDLLKKVAHLPLRLCHTDDWGAYSRLLPQEYLHRVGKQSTWKIERKNLNFRTHLWAAAPQDGLLLAKRAGPRQRHRPLHQPILLPKWHFR